MRHLRHQPLTLHRELHACRAFLKREDGHVAAEYGILLSFMGAIILAGAIALGSSVATSMSGSAVLLANNEHSASATSSAQQDDTPEQDRSGANRPESAENRGKPNSSSAGQSGIKGQMSKVAAPARSGRKAN
ncbi:MAG: hypothetical protein R3316_09055 [Rhodovibrionaceae bacterium]|nr:hypothetical protein [Rhodovibrionaceae bacterium]